MSAKEIIQQLEQLLKADQMDTRSGLYFLGELVKDAFKFIDEERTSGAHSAEALKGFETRIGNVESALKTFLIKREKEQEEAKEERKFYRQTVIGGIIAIALSELARWLLR